MKKFVLACVLIAMTLTGMAPAVAGDDYRAYAPYPYAPEPYGPRPVEPEYPLLRRLIVGGVLVGVGFAAGRLTAPQAQPYYSGYAPQPQYYPKNSWQPHASRHPGHHGHVPYHHGGRR